MNDFAIDKIFDYIVDQLQLNPVIGLILITSVSTNYGAVKYIVVENKKKQKYQKIFKEILPIITKILNNDKITKTDKEDLSRIRTKILEEII